MQKVYVITTQYKFYYKEPQLCISRYSCDVIVIMVIEIVIDYLETE